MIANLATSQNWKKKPMTKGKYPYGEKDLIHECKIRHLPFFM
jgi:hypothetical protein